MNKKKKKRELIPYVRHKAEEALYLCDEAERGKISGEEFEKRLSKTDGTTDGYYGGIGWLIHPY